MKDYPLYIKRLRRKGWEGQRGVFCEVDIPEKTVFEVCPVLLLPKDQQVHIEKTVINVYHFEFTDEGDSCLALGMGSLYNHSYSPNAEYDSHEEKEEMSFKSLCNIPAGEEIRVNYNGDYKDKSELWFEVKK